MKSKIINMVDRQKDAEDLKLEALFRSDPVEDAGFSDRVVSRVRRKIWIRRLALPTAFVIGMSIAVKPLLQLAGVVPQLLSAIPVDFVRMPQLPLDSLPQTSTIMLWAALAFAIMMIGRMLEDA